MNKKYQVYWAKVAENDLARIIEYIGKDNLSNARQILKKIQRKVSTLYTLPQRGRIISADDQG